MIEETLTMFYCLDDSRQLLQQVMSQLEVDEITWISQNRDWSEAARYELKNEVDNSLISSEVISMRRNEIERIFERESKDKPEVEYLNLLEADLRAIHSLLQTIVESEIKHRWSLDLVVRVWEDFSKLADVDNAHAMYLSSGNWQFSVFNRLTDWIYSLPLTDNDRDIILTGGVQDIRTSIYKLDVVRQLRTTNERQEFASKIKQLPIVVTDEGVMPVFLYQTASIPIDAQIVNPKLENSFKEVSALFSTDVTETDGNDSAANLRLYQKLHIVRVAYDTYEYFGFYAFARHLLILRTMQLIAKNGLDQKLAAQVHHAASLYEYRLVPRLLQQILEGGVKSEPVYVS